MGLKAIQYRTQGTCCAIMNVVLDGDKVHDVEFLGGCNGNLQGIRNLVIGMHIDEVVEKLQGIKCGAKQTSCPDQLSQCLLQYKAQSSGEIVK